MTRLPQKYRRWNVAALLVSLVACGLSAPGVLAAQRVAREPTRAECRAWVGDTTAQGDRAAVMAGWMAGCRGGARLLAGAILRAASSTDTAYLLALASQSRDRRDGAIVQAASEVALNPHASEPARAASILVLVGQAGGGYFREADLSRVLGPGCGPGVNPDEWVRTTKPDLARQARLRIVRVLDTLIADPASTPLLRNLAWCSRSAIAAS